MHGIGSSRNISHANASNPREIKIFWCSRAPPLYKVIVRLYKSFVKSVMRNAGEDIARVDLDFLLYNL